MQRGAATWKSENDERGVTVQFSDDLLKTSEDEHQHQHESAHTLGSTLITASNETIQKPIDSLKIKETGLRWSQESTEKVPKLFPQSQLLKERGEMHTASVQPHCFPHRRQEDCFPVWQQLSQ